MPKFIELQHMCLDFADKTEIIRLDKLIEDTEKKLKRFAVKTDVTERFRKMEKEIWEEMNKKIETASVEYQLKNIEEQ